MRNKKKKRVNEQKSTHHYEINQAMRLVRKKKNTRYCVHQPPSYHHVVSQKTSRATLVNSGVFSTVMLA